MGDIYHAGNTYAGSLPIDDTKVSDTSTWSSDKIEEEFSKFDCESYTEFTGYENLKTLLAAEFATMENYSVRNKVYMLMQVDPTYFPEGGTYLARIFKNGNNSSSAILQSYHSGELRLVTYWNGTWDIRGFVTERTSTDSFSPSKYISTISARRSGTTVTLNFYDLKNINEMTQGVVVTVYTLPAAYRPIAEIRQTFVTAESTPKVYRISVGADGVVQMCVYFSTSSSGLINNHTSMCYSAQPNFR